MQMCVISKWTRFGNSWFVQQGHHNLSSRPNAIFVYGILTPLQSFLSRYDFNTGGEDRLGTHDAPVRCVEYSHATGEMHYLLARVWEPH